jgi:hypothetical protein
MAYVKPFLTHLCPPTVDKRVPFQSDHAESHGMVREKYRFIVIFID